ncbi:hypothetical protein NDU88_001305 [Pleurodeles waltl]|uniref:Zinc finger CCCH-type with G patch domain-containing protein n=1 Tax=Pleurodeles waltl TaxID=8319 RepID=A0AAV7P3H5_PLEWA|nr:hypothetical protein NDU88_001305 [Pleurodeles waltl]
MDEESLVASIAAYDAQLQQVEMALRAEMDPMQQADLIQLRDDLKQLIELTESSLASMKKSKLLSTLDTTAGVLTEQDEEYLAFQEAISELNETTDAPGSKGEDLPGLADTSEEFEDSDDEEGLEFSKEDDEMSGTKVKAPYYSSWGTLEYHNAMIVGAEPPEDGNPKVRVLYLYPTHKAMKPCPYFLEEKCNFQDSCRFSHGHVVSVNELRLFENPDLSILKEGSSCLARHTDGIWYSAKITDIDNGFFTVKFDSLLLKQAVLEGDGVIPPMRSDDASSSGESEDEDNDELGFAKVIDSESAEAADWAPSCSSSFAGWEAHTRGMGSKLLVLMGYEFGKGLGKNAEGRVEPVQTVVLPKGKSLDQCAEILQRRREGKLMPRKPMKRHRKGSSYAGRKPAKRQPSRNVFDFLNEKLEGRDPKALERTAATKSTGDDMYCASQSTKKALGVQVFQTLEKIRQTEKDIVRIREALTRNVGRDSVVTSQLEARLSDARKQLEHLKAQDVHLQGQQKKADTHKKMTKF